MSAPSVKTWFSLPEAATSSAGFPPPPGMAAGDVIVIALFHWEKTSVTAPIEFFRRSLTGTRKGLLGIWWYRVTDPADVPPLLFTVTDVMTPSATHPVAGFLWLVEGCEDTGEPWEASHDLPIQNYVGTAAPTVELDISTDSLLLYVSTHSTAGTFELSGTPSMHVLNATSAPLSMAVGYLGVTGAGHIGPYAGTWSNSNAVTAWLGALKGPQSDAPIAKPGSNEPEAIVRDHPVTYPYPLPPDPGPVEVPPLGEVPTPVEVVAPDYEPTKGKDSPAADPGKTGPAPVVNMTKDKPTPSPVVTPEPVCLDPVSDIVNSVIGALRDVFDPRSACPPDGGGTTEVRFFAGDGAPLAAWDAHSTGSGCDNPFVWVRVMRRYRSEVFPSPSIDVNTCGAPRVVAIEIGVGRCAVVDLEPSWSDYAHEAEVSLDDSWRIELALCRTIGLLSNKGLVAASDALAPYGPDGGVTAWTAVLYVQF